MKKLLALLLALLMLLGGAAFAEETGLTKDIVVLFTSDVHCGIDQGFGYAGLAAVRDTLEETSHVLLVDNGDTIQGTLVAQYAINLKPDEENPMITALDYIGYDAWVMGNHEFNFTPERRDAQTRIADEAGIAVISGNIVLVEDGVDFRGEEKAAGDPFYDPYVIRTYDFGEGRTVRVAVIGLSNAANHTWDLATNYPNMQFSSLDNPDGLLAFEINKWAAEIRDNDLADIVIVSVHSGKGTDDGVETDGFLLESQVVSGVQGSSGVDLVIYGHDHTANIETLTDADGKAVPIVNGGGIRVSIPAGDITLGDILQVHPFGNALCVVEATGQQILDALEWGARNVPGENGGFLQVSGLTYEIHTYIESSCTADENGLFTGVDGEYRVKNVKVAGEDLDLTKTYTVASHNYMLKDGGDGFTMFQGCNLLQDEIKLDNQVLIDYITGIMCAVVDKKLSSEVGFKGIFKKVLIFALVGIGHILDTRVIGRGSVMRTAVIFFYISNEGVSLIENAAHLGLPIPAKLKAVLEQLHDRSEKEEK